MVDLDDRSGRDSRLLGLVIVIAIAVLVVLARFRFPEAESRPSTVTPGPLERLAARTTYDDLAAAVHTALQRIEPALVGITLEPDPQAAKGARGDGPGAASTDIRNRSGVRLGGDWAIVQVPRGFQVVRTGADDPLIVREIDAARELAMFTRPLASGEDQLPSGAVELVGFSYICVVEPTPDGPTATPVFIGRIRTLMDERWGGNVLVPGGATALPVGSLLFHLDGRFLGLVVTSLSGGIAVVPADTLIASVAAARAREPGSAR